MFCIGPKCRRILPDGSIKGKRGDTVKGIIRELQQISIDKYLKIGYTFKLGDSLCSMCSTFLNRIYKEQLELSSSSNSSLSPETAGPDDQLSVDFGEILPLDCSMSQFGPPRGTSLSQHTLIDSHNEILSEVTPEIARTECQLSVDLPISSEFPQPTLDRSLDHDRPMKKEFSLDSQPNCDNSVINEYGPKSSGLESDYIGPVSMCPREILPNDLIKTTVSIDRTYFGHSNCVVCRQRLNSKIESKNLSPVERARIFYLRRLYIKPHSKACASHFHELDRLKDESILAIPVKEKATELTQKELDEFINLIHIHGTHRLSRWERFYRPGLIEEEECQKLTGLSVIDFDQMVRFASLNMRETQMRSIRQAVVVYLFRLRSGITEDYIAMFFDLSNHQTVSHYCHEVKKSLEKSLVKSYLGFGHLTREEMLSHQTEAALIFAMHWGSPGGMITIHDGTYLFRQKPGDFAEQRKSWCDYKSHNLWKVMISCCPNGYILNAYGLCQGTENDASIFRKMIFDDPETKTAIGKLMKPKDIFGFDRGFRDLVEELQAAGYIVKMPTCKSKGESKELTTDEANDSREITKLRFIVEYINGQLKSRFRLLDGIIQNKCKKDIFLDFQIACAIYNFTFTPVIADGDLNGEIAKAMLQRRIECPRNDMIAYCKAEIRKTRTWTPLTAELVNDFPRIPQEIIYKQITLGVYQLKISLQYIRQHLGLGGKFKVFVSSAEQVTYDDGTDSWTGKILRAKIQGRFSGIKIRQVFIRYDPTKEGRSAVRMWWCNCNGGSKTVGCCGHIASVIYFLAYAQYLTHLPNAINVKVIRNGIEVIEEVGENFGGNAEEEDHDEVECLERGEEEEGEVEETDQEVNETDEEAKVTERVEEEVEEVDGTDGVEEKKKVEEKDLDDKSNKKISQSKARTFSPRITRSKK